MDRMILAGVMQVFGFDKGIADTEFADLTAAVNHPRPLLKEALPFYEWHMKVPKPLTVKRKRK